MRIGTNPEKDNHKLEIASYHRVVIPVYIPNLEEDYFKDGLTILKLCLESLLATIHSRTSVSLINNSSCPEVVAYLEHLYNSEDQIDQLLQSKINLGKVNALYSAIKSNLEPLITIADSDVLFLPNWQTETEALFQSFPAAGMVSPVPSSKGYAGQYICSTLYYGIFKSRIKKMPVLDPEGMQQFEASIGRKMYSEEHLANYLTLSKNGAKAVMGSGHFVATLRAQVFQEAPVEICQAKIVGGSENRYIDLPNDQGGYLRLSTLGNYAHHLGNTFLPWMQEKLDMIKATPWEEQLLDKVSDPAPISSTGYFIGRVLRKFLLGPFKGSFLKSKGLSKSY